MQLIKLCLILLTFNVHAIDNVADWSINSLGSGNYELVSGDHYKVTLDRTNIVPQVIDVKEYGRLKVILYKATETGTRMMYTEIYGAVVDPQAKKIIGLYPFEYNSMTEEYSNSDIDQPVWSVKGDELTIIETNLGLKKTIDIR